MNLLMDIVHDDGAIVICSLHQVGYARSYADRIIGLSHGSVLMDKPVTAFSDGDTPISDQGELPRSVGTTGVHKARQSQALLRNAQKTRAKAAESLRCLRS